MEFKTCDGDSVSAVMENLKKIIRENGKAYIRIYSKSEGTFEILDENSIMVVEKVGDNNLQGFLLRNTIESVDRREYNEPAYPLAKNIAGFYKPDLMEMKELNKLIMSLLGLGYKIEIMKDRIEDHKWVLVLRS